MKNDRVVFLDVAKGIAILLVILGHCHYKPIESFVCMFHMPVFLFVSGFFWNETDVLHPIRLALKRLKSLYIPYLKYEIVFFAMRPLFLFLGWYAMDDVAFSFSFHFLFSEIIKIILGMGREQLLGAFWFFITMLFVIGLFWFASWITYRIKSGREDIRASIIALIYLIGCVISTKVVIPRFGPALIGVIFYYLGFVFHKYNVEIKYSNISIFSTFFALIICSLFGSSALGKCTVTDPPFALCVGILGIYLVLSISKKIEYSNRKLTKLIELFGQNTVLIMAFHEIGFKILTSILFVSPINKTQVIDLSAIPVGNSSLAFVIPYFLFSVLFCYIIILIKSLKRTS